MGRWTSWTDSDVIRAKRRGRRLRMESLESRQVLAAQLVIAEIVASNNQGLRDEDRDRGDWIEILNAGDESANLLGWSLTDDPTELGQWTFPARELGPSERMVVYASGKDRTEGEELHTNFRLAKEGEYLALVRPDALTVEYDFSPAFPELPDDRSYGIVEATEPVLVTPVDTPVTALVPTSETGPELGLNWTEIDFDDSQWLTGAAGVGFDPSGGFDELIGLNISEQMLGKQSGAYVRKSFDVANADRLSSLTLGVHYEDGFVAYLNGVQVASANAPGNVDWESIATAPHRNNLALDPVEFDISEHSSLLVTGKNVLAIHGLNRSATSNDFLIGAELRASQTIPGDTTTHRFFALPTPGEPNSLQPYIGVTDPVSFDVPRGFYDQPVDIMITSPTLGASLVFTLDGSRPTESNGVVVAAESEDVGASVSLTVASTTNVRAVAIKPGFLSAPVETQTYFFLADVVQQSYESTLEAGFPNQWRRADPDYGLDPAIVGPDDAYDGQFSSVMVDALRAAPTLAITTDLGHLFSEEEGIYVNSTRSGSEWERPTSIEILMPDGQTFQSDAGLRIAGDNVRNFSNSLKQSFRLEFREDYGPTKLRFPLFDEETAEDSFDTIVLRGGYNDGWVHTPATTQYIRDQWARTTLLAMGNPQVHGRFVHVYLNGFYWGLYNAVERPVASFASDYFGGEKEDWDALNTGQVRDGDNTAWSELRNEVRAVNNEDQAVSNAAYQRLLGNHPDGTDDPELGVLIDTQNYIDYLIVNFYGGNVDWPGRNYYVARERGTESTGFKFFAWDTEKILNHGEGSTLTTNRLGVQDGVAAAYLSLATNDEFRLQFADRVHQHFFNGGMLYVDPENPAWDPEHPERNRPAATYAQLASEVELPLVAESARWGDTQSGGTRSDGRTYTVNDWKEFQNDLFNEYFPRRSEIVMQQFVEAGLYPSVAAPVFNRHGGVVQSGFGLSMSGEGSIYYTLDGSDPRQSALEVGVEVAGVSPSAQEYLGEVVLTRGVTVNARAFVDGQWSALNSATFTLTAPTLRISELMYHPRDPAEGSPFDAEQFEFIELVNESTEQAVSLAGVRFSEGVTFEFTGGTLGPGDRGVIVNDRSAFVSRYGETINILGEYGPDGTRLSNSGEGLVLVDAVDNVLHELVYSDDLIPLSDGGGYSIVVMEGDVPTWRQGLERDGSPGREDQLDMNADGNTTPADVDLFCLSLRQAAPGTDLNGLGGSDPSDFRLLMQRILGVQVGDVNLDGRFDSTDLTLVFQNQQGSSYEDNVPGNSLWSTGDWNCDGDFTTSDLVVAFIEGNYVNDEVAAEPVALNRTLIAGALADRIWAERDVEEEDDKALRRAESPVDAISIDREPRS